MTVLLMSSAYVAEELAAEFGKLPPSFLPIGNKRLFNLQAALLQSQRQKVLISLPEGFEVPFADQRALDALGVEVIRVPGGLSLGEAIVYILNCAGIFSGAVSILHGDTYFTEALASKNDSVSLADSVGNYSWASYFELHPPGDRFALKSNSSKHVPVLSGYFSFSDAQLLIKALSRARGDFIEGLNLYDREVPISGIRPKGAWLDFGHVQTYYRSRWYLTSQRSFNSLTIEGDIVLKTSSVATKVNSEANWYESIPASVKIFTPLYLGREKDSEADVKGGYRLAHEYLAPLSDLFVFGALPENSWVEIFDACRKFLVVCAEHVAPEDLEIEISDLFRKKAKDRVGEFCRDEGLDPKEAWIVNGGPLPGLGDVVEELLIKIESRTPPRICVMHGDLCFSNILFDFRRRAIKVIDPRGHIDGVTPTIFGDPRYDLAKLSHSVNGLYDYIIAGAFDLRKLSSYALDLEIHTTKATRKVQNMFSNERFGGLSAASMDVRAATALLFLSMLPLHKDDRTRQSALLARGLQLSREVIEGP